MHSKDLSTILHYNGIPVRVGVINNTVFYCLSDLLTVMKVHNVNVTHILVRVPPDVYHKATTIDLTGFVVNTRVTAVTYEGAILVLPRLSKVDLMDVLRLIRWMATINKEKLKKGA
ncbi:hypothetical protein [Brevibacillus laterosporus]|uniref:hypothetical protein n=1 Tax=Brevibacillus laterosporus TaxID=1465 RepID=UPI003D252B7B